MSFSWSFSFSLTNLYKWDWIEYIWANQKFSLSWFGVECLLYNRRLKKNPNKWVIMVPSPCSAGKGNILPPTATRTTEKFLRSEVDYKWYIWDPHYLRKNIHPQVQVWLKGFRNPRLSHPLRHIYLFSKNLWSVHYLLVIMHRCHNAMMENGGFMYSKKE